MTWVDTIHPYIAVSFAVGIALVVSFMLATAPH
jgi:hypothetical protein